MKKSFFKKFLVVVLVISLFGLVGCAQENGGTKEPGEETSPAKTQHYSFVSSNPGGTWYNMVGGAVNLFNEKMDNVNFSIEASGGSVENTRRVASGEAEFGLAYASHMHEVWNGIGAFEGNASQTIRGLAEVTTSPHYFVTLKNKGITSMSDLKGKRVALGAPGSGTSYNSRAVLEALGIEVDATELSFSDAAQALQDGRIDALGQGGAPAAGVVELAAAQDIYIIPFTDEELDKFIAEKPSYDKGILPANTYEGQEEDVLTFEFSVFWIAHEDVDEDVVYECLKTAFDPEGFEYLSSVHPQWKTMQNNPQGLENIGVPYHPGAERYWSEH